jgi:type II secretory pathway pseudopilin PulG
MRLNISTFSVMLLSAFALLMFLLWSLSLMVLVDRQNQQNAASYRQNLHGQILQLQQKQQLWLQSQHYLLNTLVESPGGDSKFQSFLWDYYQRNPSIWAVNLIEFDPDGNPVSRSSKPGCRQPGQLHRSNFDDYLVPVITSCRIDDKALLEIAGPVTTEGNARVLLLSMDYFDFLSEFSALSGRRLQRAADFEGGVQYHEFGLNDGDLVRVVLRRCWWRPWCWCCCCCIST